MKRTPAFRPRAISASPGDIALERIEDYYVGRFSCMASPCEVLVDTDDRDAAMHATRTAAAEARRIERKYSRYRDDSEIHCINGSAGTPVRVDDETSRLFDYADACHTMSDGRFDITSGVLRRAWTFDGGSRIPDAETVRKLVTLVGWHRVVRTADTITLPPGMELDLGGIGKEYAVDRAALLISHELSTAFMVNFGGDLFASATRRGGRTWAVGVDDPERTGEGVLYRVDLGRGGLATSGDARRFVMWNGRRLGHILDPRSGWPVEGAPRSVTVVGRTCVEAGTLSTLAYLRGPGAAEFLRAQGVEFRIT